ncbi:hypothetical protein Pla52o_55480 [Novipirellula galeiformis]|uniref:DUF4886 domain-containing protein n=1 Tax=Novipirellula galeiformis TaxID=2528004 RepID=A0A5C6BU49_9BACT|nr:DUF4886 domain-containing protein [Novipirellula galeiformis]TWU15011.1 hypothetical protein Pla52o_55480 [Novipirellula galeiformis]
MFRSRIFLWFLACTVLGACESSGADPKVDSPKHVRILTIGNSFTRNATRYLGEITEAAGHKLTHKMLSIGGSPLELHAAKALAFEQDRSDRSAKYSSGESLQEALQSEPWDFVTIQQVSIKSHDIETYRPYAEQLADIIHRYAPQARLLVHQTWAYRNDDPRFHRSSTPEGEPATQQAMYEGLSEAYRTIVAELSARRIPVGDAFWIADNDPNYGYRAPAEFDATQFKFPDRPESLHSLHVGYRWLKRDGKQQLRMDGHHANLAGEYLGACVWFEGLFAESVVGNRFVPDKLDPKYAAFLQTVAHQAAQQGGDVVRGIPNEPTTAWDDPSPQRYQFRVRASEIDSRTGEYPKIGFVSGSREKPADMEFASVDTRVAPQGKLAIWLMGHNSGLFERLNEYGIHAIGVSYARGWFGKLAQPRPADAYARGRIRLEAATGLDFSDELDLLPPDGAAERARQMVLWLSKENPQGNWEQFLADDGSRLRWDKIIVTGASHGSTTAARFAQHQRVDRVVMLCGPRDQDQDWQSLPSATPANRFFGFTHVLDGGWTGDHYCRSWEMLGLHAFGPIVNVDSTPPPYENSRRLITAADVGGDARRAHGSVTPGGSSPKDANGELRFDPVWRYLYNHPVDAVGEASEEDPDCQRIHVSYD